MRRWWGIRHCRYYLYTWRLSRWMLLWSAYYPIPSPGDLAYLDAVWKGEA